MLSQLALASLVGSAAALQAQLPLPPMGFNNWARFLTNISESIFVDAADVMEARGLLAAGYNRINLDDAWSTKERRPNGSMAWDPVKFPRGLPWLTAHLKQRRFIPGIYSDAGSLSCAGYPSTLDHEATDLRDFSSWGFEYLKLDGCYLPDDSEATYHQVYARWHQLLAAEQRPVVFSDSAPAYFSGHRNLTDWYKVLGWAQAYGQLARHSADIQSYPDGDAWKSIMYNYEQELGLARYQRPGFFNDPDFLVPDHPSLSPDEKRSHFSLWCVLSAPLILSADLGALPDDEVAFLTNRDLIAVNQDRLAQQATLVASSDQWDVLTKSLGNGDRVVAVLNKGDQPGDQFVGWASIGLALEHRVGRGQPFADVKDLWTGQRSKVYFETGGVKARRVPAHGTAVFRVTPRINAVVPTGIIFNQQSRRCLTESGVPSVPQATWAKCDGTNRQVWRIEHDGRIHGLESPHACLGVDSNGRVAGSGPGCSASDHSWTYHVSGNLVDSKSGLCLTEGQFDKAVATKCGFELNEQVISMPVGVPVVGA